jgi:hypothetical protein
VPEKLMQGLNITYNAGVSPPNAAIAAVTPHDSCAATHSLASCDVDRGLTQPTAAVGFRDVGVFDYARQPVDLSNLDDQLLSNDCCRQWDSMRSHACSLAIIRQG